MEKCPIITFILPCHNEAKSIRPLIHEICLELEKFPRKLKLIFLLVDDHSSDQTHNVIKSLEYSNTPPTNTLLRVEIRALQLEHQSGKAQAQALGIRVAANHCDHLILMDSDGQHDPQNLPGLIEDLLKNKATYLGSRVDYERKTLESFFMKCFVFLNKIMGIRFKPEWSEYLGIPATRARHLSSLPQLGIIPITSLVMMTYPDTRIFSTRVRKRIDGTNSSRWNAKTLVRKALMHLFCDPWTFFPRLLFISSVPLIFFFFMPHGWALKLFDLAILPV
jgi:glycosyltransferase involved in cell wall biosynthesis